MKSIISYHNKTPFWKNALVISSAVLFVYVLLNNGIISIIFLGFSYVLLQREGAEINLITKQYRTFISVLGIKFGKWKTLPKQQYISVFSTTESTRIWAASASAKVKNDVILLNLFSETNKKIEIYKTYDLNEAFDIALRIANDLKIDLLDATTPNDYKWVDLKTYTNTGKIKYID